MAYEVRVGNTRRGWVAPDRTNTLDATPAEAGGETIYLSAVRNDPRLCRAAFALFGGVCGIVMTLVVLVWILLYAPPWVGLLYVAANVLIRRADRVLANVPPRQGSK